MLTAATKNSDYLEQFNGDFSAILRWPALDVLEQQILGRNDGYWWLYEHGQPIPERTADPSCIETFLKNTFALLRKTGPRDYCGVVFVDDKSMPAMIKIFDPRLLGCGSGTCNGPTRPSWILSRTPPVSLDPPAKRNTSWWRR